jgi:hypothetical protein
VTRVRALPVPDALERDGESVVLQAGRVSRLSAPATVIRSRCTDWTPVEELASLLVETFGEPPGGQSLQVTRAWVDELVSAGLIEVHESDPDGANNS